VKFQEFIAARAGKRRAIGKRLLKAVLVFVGINIAYIAFAVVFSPPMLRLYYWFPKHPDKAHGTTPQEFVGFWKMERSDQVFILHPNGVQSESPGMDRRRWHYDDGLLYLDFWGTCGSCLPFGLSESYNVTFDGPDRMLLEPDDKDRLYGTNHGWFTRVTYTEEWEQELIEQEKSEDYATSTRAYIFLLAIRDAREKGLQIPGGGDGA